MAKGQTAPGLDTCVVLYRLRGAARWSSTDTRNLPDGRIFVRPSRLVAGRPGFDDGTYDLYVAERGTGCAAALTGVRLFGEQDNELDVDLRPGTFLRLGSLVEPDVVLSALEVRTPELGALPLLVLEPRGWRSFDDAREITRMLATPREDALFGPLPAAAVDVDVALEDGTRKGWRVSGANAAERR